MRTKKLIILPFLCMLCTTLFISSSPKKVAAKEENEKPNSPAIILSEDGYKKIQSIVLDREITLTLEEETNQIQLQSKISYGFNTIYQPTRSPFTFLVPFYHTLEEMNFLDNYQILYQTEELTYTSLAHLPYIAQEENEPKKYEVITQSGITSSDLSFISETTEVTYYEIKAKQKTNLEFTLPYDNQTWGIMNHFSGTLEKNNNECKAKVSLNKNESFSFYIKGRNDITFSQGEGNITLQKETISYTKYLAQVKEKYQLSKEAWELSLYDAWSYRDSKELYVSEESILSYSKKPHMSYATYEVLLPNVTNLHFDIYVHTTSYFPFGKSFDYIFNTDDSLLFSSISFYRNKVLIVISNRILEDYNFAFYMEGNFTLANEDSYFTYYFIENMNSFGLEYGNHGLYFLRFLLNSSYLWIVPVIDYVIRIILCFVFAFGPVFKKNNKEMKKTCSNEKLKE